MKKRLPRPGQVVLERALSKLGLASRAQAHEWILAGRVKVNGVLRVDPGFPVAPEKARIEIEGELREKSPIRVLALHKTRGTVTTHSDEKGRPTVFSLLTEPGLHLIAVGRLDLATTGLLLLTNDTRLAAELTDPDRAVPRVYLVCVRGQVSEAGLKRLKLGVKDDGELLKAAQVELRKSSARESHLTITLTQGKNREIRRLFLAIGHEVKELKRVSFGPIELGALAPGKYRELDATELVALRSCVRG